MQFEMFCPLNKLKKIPQSRIELHVHLEGAVRHATIWDLAKEKKVELPGIKTFQDLEDSLTVKSPVDLQHFVKKIKIYSPVIIGDFDALERIAYEFCEDEAKNGVRYVEARYNPHLLIKETRFPGSTMSDLCKVVESVRAGFERGYEDFSVKAQSVLFTRNGVGIVREILELAQKYKGEGVVGIDIASDVLNKSDNYEEVPLNSEEIYVFEEARKMGIHRTIHAGEAGGPEMVQRAIQNYNAERIGHGYRVVQSPNIYEECKTINMHFECCLWSSFLTGAVPLDVKKHPIVRLAEDGANFSVNSDNPTITGHTLADDYALASSFGLTEAHFIRANFNAAKSCFLPEDEKQKLINELKETLMMK